MFVTLPPRLRYGGSAEAAKKEEMLKRGEHPCQEEVWQGTAAGGARKAVGEPLGRLYRKEVNSRW